MTQLALGTMNFGWRTPRDEAERIVARALERGITLFDTANVYHDGESEKILGEALRKHARPGAAEIATKVGLMREHGRAEGLSKPAIEKAVKASLERLGVETIDLYYLHAPDYETPIEQTLEAVAGLLERKVIRKWGISNYASWQVLEMIHWCDAHQVARPVIGQHLYNVLIRELEIEWFRFAARYQLHTTVYNALAGGLFSGRYQPGDQIREGTRFFKNRMYQQRYWTERTFAFVEEVKRLAAEAGMPITTLAYAWLANRKGVGSILIGPGSVEHLDAAIDGTQANVPDDLAAKLDALHEAHLGTNTHYAR